MSELRYTWTASLSTTPAYKLANYTFTGQYSYMDDPSTAGLADGFGLMFYNARWYDPVSGRFAQADSIVPGGVQGLDRYAYVNNAPTRFTDPSGHNIKPPHCFICNITWLNYSDVSGIANKIVDGLVWMGCLIVGCHVNSTSDIVTGPTEAEWMYAGVMGMVTPLDMPPSASAPALQQNYERGLLYRTNTKKISHRVDSG